MSKSKSLDVDDGDANILNFNTGKGKPILKQQKQTSSTKSKKTPRLGSSVSELDQPSTNTNTKHVQIINDNDIINHQSFKKKKGETSNSSSKSNFEESNEKRSRPMLCHSKTSEMRMSRRERWLILQYIYETIHFNISTRMVGFSCSSSSTTTTATAATTKIEKKKMPVKGNIPIILVPGFFGSPLSFRLMEKRLRQKGFQHVHRIDTLGFMLNDINIKASLLSEYLDGLGYDEVIIVGHSKGGLIGNRCLMNGEKRIKLLLTLGTPYYGTWLGFTILFLQLSLLFLTIFILKSVLLTIILPVPLLLCFFNIPSVKQMLPIDIRTGQKNPFLSEIRQFARKNQRFIKCIYAERDQVVIRNPFEWFKVSCLHIGDNDHIIDEFGHMNLFMGESAIEKVILILLKYT